MKICIVIGAFLPVPPVKGGGVEKMWFQLAKEFALLGNEVLIISKEYDGFPKNETIEGVNHLRVSGFETPSNSIHTKVCDLIYARRACKAIPKDFDIIVTNTFWAPIIIAASQKSKVYVDVARMPKGQMLLYRRVGRLRANSSPVAKAIKDELSSEFHKLVKTIPNPLPFNATDQKFEGERGRRMLYVGRIHPEKGIHLILSAMRQIPNPWPLRIVGPWRTSEGGDEHYFRYLESISHNLPVEFVGPVFDFDELNNEYQTASLFLYPSLAEKGETFGLAPLEAMAWGCVPVVSDLECFKDFISHETNGLIFDHRGTNPDLTLAACLQKIMSNSEKMRTLAEKSIDVRQSHSPYVIANLFLEDFRKMSIHSEERST